MGLGKDESSQSVETGTKEREKKVIGRVIDSLVIAFP